jgi:hypothetical protein
MTANLQQLAKNINDCVNHQAVYMKGDYQSFPTVGNGQFRLLSVQNTETLLCVPENEYPAWLKTHPYPLRAAGADATTRIDATTIGGLPTIATEVLSQVDLSTIFK